ncbi:MAG: trigger factor [Clostridia bacterium]|nr:trigger factor [Clostridia bacterium]
MKYTVKADKNSTVKIKITLNAEEWANAQKQAYEKTKGKFAVPGFRKGKVPMSYIVKAYGESVFFEEAINLSFAKHYYDILDKEPDIEVIDRPELSVDKIDEKGIVLVATVPVKPEVKLGEYKGINIDKVTYNVSDADVDAELNRLAERNAREVEIEGRSAQSGDITNIDYSGAIDGVKFDGGTAEGQSLVLGSGQFIPGFEEGVVGMNIGETKDIAVTFPENYAPELAGKDAIFTVKLNGLKLKELPEINDEFIKDAAGEESVDAFKAATKARLQEANDKKAKYETEDKLIKTIADASEVEVPASLVERQIDNNVRDMEYRMMYHGLKLDDYLKYTNQTLLDYRKTFEKQAQEQVKTQLVIEAILKAEKIVATTEEVDAKIAEQATQMGKDVAEYKKSIPANQLTYFENNVLIDKLFAFLTENNKID